MNVDIEESNEKEEALKGYKSHTHTIETEQTHKEKSLEKETLCCFLDFLAHIIINILQWQNIFHACQQYDPCIDCSILIQISSWQRKVSGATSFILK